MKKFIKLIIKEKMRYRVPLVLLFIFIYYNELFCQTRVDPQNMA